MSRSDNRLAALSEYLEFRRGADLEEDSYMYLHEKWYEIKEIDGSRVLGSLAGYSRRTDLGIEVEYERLYVTIPAGTPLQFRHGQPRGTQWPNKDLIYVEAAYRRARAGRSAGTSERVHGLFLRKWDVEDGRSHYIPHDPEGQGIPDTWILDEDQDMVVSWRPVTAAEILGAVGK